VLNRINVFQFYSPDSIVVFYFNRLLPKQKPLLALIETFFIHKSWQSERKKLFSNIQVQNLNIAVPKNMFRLKQNYPAAETVCYSEKGSKDLFYLPAGGGQKQICFGLRHQRFFNHIRMQNYSNTVQPIKKPGAIR
jgi:hypothetical protein